MEKAGEEYKCNCYISGMQMSEGVGLTWKTAKMNAGEEYKCNCYISGIQMSEGVGLTWKAAKMNAAWKAFGAIIKEFRHKPGKYYKFNVMSD